MTRDDWRKAKEIFAAALEKPAETRDAFVERLCGGDASLRGHVLALLDAHERAERADPAPAAAADEGPGDRIGPYKLLQEIGTGGFGTVYMAEQTEPVRRKVALKIVKLGMDTRQVIARFEAERQALALMDHPNIARVLDAGATATGRPYFVMELVKGIPITEYCDQAGLDTAQRLDLFQQVCHAVQHAHQKGVIHRDLKPSNLLVTLHDGRPVPKVIDFGIAKATDHRLTEKTLFTEFRQIIGTPEYMSPEQAELSGLDVDTRSDIYSLGVLLYELLTGTKPFDMRSLLEKGFDEMLRVIREVDPPKPSTRLSTMGEEITGVAKHRRTAPRLLNRLVKGDLDWIVMKALEKDRSRRYDTAGSFAADLGRFLNNVPIEARPPNPLYRARKFVRRHRVGVAATAAVVVALAAGLAVAASGWREAARREKEARTEATRANEVVALVDGILGAAHPHASKGVGYTVREMLDEFDRALGDQLAGEPEVEATVRALIGNAYRGLGLPERAGPQLAAALELRRRIGSPRLQESRRDWAWHLHDLDRFEESAAEMKALLDESGHAADHHGLSDNLRHLRRFDEAERHAREAVRLWRAAPGDNRRQVAATLSNLGAVLFDRGDAAAAEGVLREALETSRDLDAPGVGMALNGLGLVLEALGRNDEAEQAFRESIALWRQAVGRDDQVVLSNLARLLRRTGRMEEAEEAGRRALEAARLALGERHMQVASFLHQLAHTVCSRGRTAEAAELYRKALAHARAHHEGDHEDVAHAVAGLAECTSLLGNHEQAEGPCREALEMRRRIYGDSVVTATSLNNLAGVLRELGRFDEALDASREALAMARRVVGDDHVEFATHLNQQGMIQRRRGELEDAERCLREALGIYGRTIGEEHSDYAVAVNNLALAVEDRGDLEEAARLYEQAVEIGRRTLGTGHPEVIVYRLNLTFLCLSRDDVNGALHWSREALEAAEAHLPEHDPRTAWTRSVRAEVLLFAGNARAAEPLARRAVVELEATRGADHRETLHAKLILAEAVLNLNALEAVPMLAAIRARLHARAGPVDADTMRATSLLAMAQRSTGDAEGSCRTLEAALADIEASDTDEPWGVLCASSLLQLRLMDGDTAGAAELARALVDGRYGGAGRDDPEAHAWLAMVGMALLEAGDHAGAEPVLLECLAMRRKQLPEGDWLTCNAMSLLGGSLAGQGKYAEAEPLLIEGYEKMEPPPPLAFRKPEVLARVVELYEAWEKPEEAAKWRALQK